MGNRPVTRQKEIDVFGSWWACCQTGPPRFRCFYGGLHQKSWTCQEKGLP